MTHTASPFTMHNTKMLHKDKGRDSHKHNSTDWTKSWHYITMMTLQGRKKLTTVKYEITSTVVNTVRLNTRERGQTMWSASTGSLSQHRSNRHIGFFVTCCMLANGVFAELKCSWHNATSSFITEHAQPCFHLWTCALMVTFMVLMTVHAQCTVKYNKLSSCCKKHDKALQGWYGDRNCGPTSNPRLTSSSVKKFTQFKCATC